MGRVDDILKRMNGGSSNKDTQRSESRVDRIINTMKTSSYTPDSSILDSFASDYETFAKAASSDYNSVNYKNSSEKKEQYKQSAWELKARINEILAQYNLNRSELSDEEQKLKNYLVSARRDIGSVESAYNNASRFYSQFASETDYNNWYKKEIEKKNILGAEDFEANRGYVSTKSDNFWDKMWSEYSLGYDDLTYEYINNQDGLRDEIKSKYRTYSRDNAYAEAESDYEQKGYDFLTDDEVGIYNYYYRTQGKEKAQEFLDNLETTLVQRKAGREFENLKGNTVAEMLYGIVAGTDQFRQGVENIGSMITGDEGFTSSTQHVSGMVREDLADDGFNVLGSSAGQIGYDLINTSANMLPSILVGSATGGLGGAFALGASATGNAYTDMRNLGYDEWQSRGYAALVGASETGLQYVLGGISNLGGKVSGNAVSKLVSKLDNALARTAIKLGSNMASEGLEEAIQTILEPAFKALVTGEDFESPEWDEILYSGLLGALSAGVLEGAPTITDAVDSNYQTYKLMGGMSNTEAVKAFWENKKIGDVKNAYNEGKQNVREMAGYYVNEALEIDPDNAHAQRMQAKLDQGKDISGYQINRLIEANENAMLSQDKEKIKAAVEAQLLKYGETGDVAKIADVITKIRSDEKITRAERNILVNSEFGRRVSTEMNPEVIKEGTHNSSWVEEIGTDRISADVYNRIGERTEFEPDVSFEPHIISPDDDENKNEKGMESEISAYPDTKITIERDGKDIEVKVDKIESVENGETSIKLEDGEVVNASDVDFGDSGIGFVYKSAAEMVSGVGGFNIDAANLMVRGFNPRGTMEQAGLYVNGFNTAYRYGAMGYPVSALATGVETSKLTAKVRETAYNLGKAFGVGKVAEKQAKIDSTKVINANKDSQKAFKNKKGKVFFDGKTYGKSLTERQRASLKGLRTVAEALGIDIHIFESEIVDGKRQGANGWYDPSDNSIHIDLFAGIKGESLMLYTAAHELTHHIREVAPAKFKVFADALLEEYTKNGVSIDELIQKKLESLEANGRLEGKTEEQAYDLAYEEVVADSCEAMLVDSDAIEALSRKIKAKDKGLWQTIKDFIAKLVARIKAAYKGLDPDSIEGKRVREMVASAERLQKLWVDALLEASEVGTYIGTINLSDFADAKNENGESLFQYRAMEADEAAYRKMLSKWGKMSSNQINNLFATIDNAMELIKENLEVLDYAWEADIDDRAFSPVKPNSDKLYQVSLDFSTLCRKRILQ
jgi:hypothetical protein